MDKDQARFILRSFRPDGADAEDPDFAEALKLAMENRELGEWLAHERAFDAAFTAALASVDLPRNLRDDILAGLAVERGDFPQAEDLADAAWIGALGSIRPPDGLRDEVLAAMDRSVERTTRGKISPFRRFAMPMAAAAGIALAILITRQETPETNATVARISRIPVEAVQAGFLRTFESPEFALEEKNTQQLTLIRHLQERKLPCPSCMPAGLQRAAGLGCRELEIDGKRGSLICFNLGDGGVVHLVVFRSEDVECQLPGLNDPEFASIGDWSSARWEHDGKVFMLMGHTGLSTLTALF